MIKRTLVSVTEQRRFTRHRERERGSPERPRLLVASATGRGEANQSGREKCPPGGAGACLLLASVTNCNTASSSGRAGE